MANDGYETALTALRAFFVQKVNVVAERNKFRQRAQRFSEPIVQYVAALRELLVTCDFGALADDMIKDQIVEKTCTSRIRERLLLETDLTLQKAITIAGQIESAVAEAKAMERTETSVKVVHTGSREGAKQRWRQRKSTFSHQMPSNVSQKKLDAKTCFRCGTTSHLANYPKCPAKQSNCRQCGKVGHIARVLHLPTMSKKLLCLSERS